MEIDTQYAVRRFFPASAFAQIYFEAVANAFDAGATQIDISIDSDGEIAPTRLLLEISDDGEGFTAERFEAFRRLQEPKDEFHKGLGRLVYLQYFDAVHVQSRTSDKLRTFQWSDDFGSDGGCVVEKADNAETGTNLQFDGFRRGRLRSYDNIKPQTIKRDLLAQFLPLLHDKKLRGDRFCITVTLQTDAEREQYDFFSTEVSLTPDDVPNFDQLEISAPGLGVFDRVTMYHFIDHDSGDGSVSTAVSVDGRSVPIDLVPERPLPVGYSATFLFVSDLFQGQSDSARQRLVLPDDVSMSTLRGVLRDAAAGVLHEQIPAINAKNAATRDHFEHRYPHLAGLFDLSSVGLIDKFEALKSANRRFFSKQMEVLEGDPSDDVVLRQSIELSSRSLAEYVVYRDFIVRRLENVTEEDREAVVHNLVVPQYRRYEGADFLDGVYSNNAWILDDRFMTFRTVLSESEMGEVIQAITLDSDELDEKGRPDISLIFSADPDEAEAVDVVIVEVKKRKADDKEGLYAINQLVDRASLLINNCSNIQRAWYFGVIEIDDKIRKYLTNTGWTQLFSHGEVFYQEYPVEGVNTAFHLMSWDAVVKDASARNHTFLELLKNDIKSAGNP